MVRSYVKIFGPPMIKAIKALEGVAVDMSKAIEVKFSHRCIPYPRFMQSNTADYSQYLKNMQRTYVDCYEPVKIISEAHQMLGEYDFFYEWTEAPRTTQINDLLDKIDSALEDLGCYYTLTTK